MAENSDTDKTDTPAKTKPARKTPKNLPAIKAAPRGVTKTGDLLSYYLAQVRRYPLLTPEQEKYLASWQEGTV